MDCRQPAARHYKIQQCLLLNGRNLRVVGIDEETVVTRKLRRAQVGQRGGIIKLNMMPGEDRLQLPESVLRTMMIVVPQKKHPDGWLRLRASGRQDSQRPD